jgi:hypothetical protein
MVVTLFRLPHPASCLIIITTVRKQSASNFFVCSSSFVFFAISFVPHSSWQEQRIGSYSRFYPGKITEIGLHALQSPSGAFRNPFATSVKPLRKLPDPLYSDAMPFGRSPNPHYRRCNALATISAPPLHSCRVLPEDSGTPFHLLKRQIGYINPNFLTL